MKGVDEVFFFCVKSYGELPETMKSENRRTFVKKTFAATAALSFAGLIRAHGEDPEGETTVDPWGETTEPEFTDTTESWETTEPWEETTTPVKPLIRTYTKTVYLGDNQQWSDSPAYYTFEPNFPSLQAPMMSPPAVPTLLNAAMTLSQPSTDYNGTKAQKDIKVETSYSPVQSFPNPNGNGNGYKKTVTVVYSWIYE